MFSRRSYRIIDLQDYFFRFTLDGFCKIAYNHDLKSMDAEKTIPFALAFDAAQSVLEWRFMFPLWRIEEWITPKGKRMQGYVQTMREFSRALIHQRREESTRASQEGLDVKARHDLLTLFQDLKTDDGEPLYSQEQLTDLVINFIIAGRGKLEVGVDINWKT